MSDLRRSADENKCATNLLCAGKESNWEDENVLWKYASVGSRTVVKFVTHMAANETFEIVFTDKL